MGALVLPDNRRHVVGILGSASLLVPEGIATDNDQAVRVRWDVVQGVDAVGIRNGYRRVGVGQDPRPLVDAEEVDGTARLVGDEQPRPGSGAS